MSVVTCHSQRHHRLPGLLGLLAVAVALVACGGSADPVTTSMPAASASNPPPSAAALQASRPAASLDAAGLLCARVGAVEERLAALRAVELRLPNRVALDIELAKLQAAFGELAAADLGSLEERLEDPLVRLGRRLAELELAVEDFRTNSRPQRAVPHVEGDAATLADELGAFAILARC
jgi:hypothetical protein